MSMRLSIASAHLAAVIAIFVGLIFQAIVGGHALGISLSIALFTGSLAYALQAAFDTSADAASRRWKRGAAAFVEGLAGLVLVCVYL